MKKRIIASSLVLLLLLSSMMSCSEKNMKNNSDESDAVKAETAAETASAETTAETTQYIEDDLEDVDLGGYKFRILSSHFGIMSGNYITYDELTGDVLNDALYNSTISVEERFNCDISTVELGADWGWADAARSAVRAGDDAFDLSIGHDMTTVPMSKSGIFYDMFKIPHLNFDKPWWPKNTVENLSISNKMYVASSYLSYCGLHFTRILVMNKDKANDFDLEMPYQTVLDGKWTFDKMSEMVKDVAIDLNGDGKMEMEDDFFGFSTGDQTWYCMQQSVDLKPYKKDENGHRELSLDLEKADKYVEMSKKLMSSSGYVEQANFGVEPFKNGQALMAHSSIEDICNSYRGGDVVYGIIPTPKFDENQPEYISCCTDLLMGVPITVEKNIDKVGTIIEALSCSNYNKVIPAYFEIVLSKKLADAPEDAAMLNIIRDTRTIGFGHTYQMPFYNVAELCMKSGKNLASLYATQEKLAIKMMNNLEKTFENLH